MSGQFKSLQSEQAELLKTFDGHIAEVQAELLKTFDGPIGDVESHLAQKKTVYAERAYRCF